MIVRIALIALAVVVVTPIALMVAYRFVDPPAMPILRAHLAGRQVTQDWTPLADINPRVTRAVIMAEDARFCLHHGVDWAQLKASIREARGGGAPRGASTITMQTVKTLFLWPQRDYVRKAVEVPLSLIMDLVLPKRRILEIYLNVAQWGPAQYGVEAGSQYAFGRATTALSNRQALALATVLPAPSVRRANTPTRRQQAVMNHVSRELASAPWVFSCLPAALRP